MLALGLVRIPKKRIILDKKKSTISPGPNLPSAKTKVRGNAPKKRRNFRSTRNQIGILFGGNPSSSCLWIT